MGIRIAILAMVFAQTRGDRQPTNPNPPSTSANRHHTKPPSSCCRVRSTTTTATRCLSASPTPARRRGHHSSRIDTYGGIVTSGLDISRFIKQQTDVHTIAFVHNKAISAGAMIAMACDEIVMEPSAVIGDCAPIMLRTDGSLDPMPDTERAKMESPVLADFRDSAQRNGYSHAAGGVDGLRRPGGSLCASSRWRGSDS